MQTGHGGNIRLLHLVLVPHDLARRIMSAVYRNAVLRRNDPMAAGKTLDGLLIDERGGAAILDGTVLTLTRGEFRLLALLSSRPGRVYTRAQIIDMVQDEEKSVTERTVDVQLVGLRKKLGDWAAHIETIRGVGYRVKP